MRFWHLPTVHGNRAEEFRIWHRKRHRWRNRPSIQLGFDTKRNRNPASRSGRFGDGWLLVAVPPAVGKRRRCTRVLSHIAGRRVPRSVLTMRSRSNRFDRFDQQSNCNRAARLTLAAAMRAAVRHRHAKVYALSEIRDRQKTGRSRVGRVDDRAPVFSLDSCGSIARRLRPTPCRNRKLRRSRSKSGFTRRAVQRLTPGTPVKIAIEKRTMRIACDACHGHRYRGQQHPDRSDVTFAAVRTRVVDASPTDSQCAATAPKADL